MKNTITLLIALLSSASAFAQNNTNTVRGKITDQETGSILPGATIRVTGTNISTKTNNTGEFELADAQKINNITVSYTGYKTQQSAVDSNSKFINIDLSVGSPDLSNVTVTSYQNNRKLLETAGAIALVTSKDIQRGDNTSILSALNNVA